VLAEPSAPHVKTLFAVSGNECAMDECHDQLTNPSWRSVKARVCHIRAQSPGGPRHDPTYPDVHGYENLILLCVKCHNRVDDLEPHLWSVDRLTEMKIRHEESATRGWATAENFSNFASVAIRLTVAYEDMQQRVRSIDGVSGGMRARLGGSGSIEGSDLGSSDAAPDVLDDEDGGYAGSSGIGLLDDHAADEAYETAKEARRGNAPAPSVDTTVSPETIRMNIAVANATPVTPPTIDLETGPSTLEFGSSDPNDYDRAFASRIEAATANPTPQTVNALRRAMQTPPPQSTVDVTPDRIEISVSQTIPTPVLDVTDSVEADIED
jgi:hypothetical protein